MQTKTITAAILFVCCTTIGRAQNETQTFKFNPAPFDSKIPLRKQFIKPFPRQLQKSFDSSRYSHQSALGDIYTAPQDGMPILKPYPQNTDYERRRVLKEYRVEPFGTPTYIDPMPNPLNKALISK